MSETLDEALATLKEQSQALPLGPELAAELTQRVLQLRHQRTLIRLTAQAVGAAVLTTLVSWALSQGGTSYEEAAIRDHAAELAL